ncbi:MAG: hypothetical protein K8I82_03815, partial [Anaerolineae bacterium]|nr:hypothetical protein [Anaerolineae bacterium]
QIVITLLGQVAEAKEKLMLVKGVQEILDLKDEGGRKRIQVNFNGEDAGISELLTALTSSGIPVMNFAEQTQDLEAVFMRATRGIVT